MPTLHARVGGVVYVHGSSASRAIRSLTGGLPACLTVTLLDGLVLARSAFHHSMNYRSAVGLGEARPVEGPDQRLGAVEAVTGPLGPGRGAGGRPPAPPWMTYRWAVGLGGARRVGAPDERRAALEAFTERLVPGRWEGVRPPTRQELKGTRVLAFDLGEASAKVRTGPPVDDDEDYELDVWAGVIPLALTPGQLTPDPQLTPGLEPSHAVRSWGR